MRCDLEPPKDSAARKLDKPGPNAMQFEHMLWAVHCVIFELFEPARFQYAGAKGWDLPPTGVVDGLKRIWVDAAVDILKTVFGLEDAFATSMSDLVGSAAANLSYERVVAIRKEDTKKAFEALSVRSTEDAQDMLVRLRERYVDAYLREASVCVAVKRARDSD